MRRGAEGAERREAEGKKGGEGRGPDRTLQREVLYISVRTLLVCTIGIRKCCVL